MKRKNINWRVVMRMTVGLALFFAATFLVFKIMTTRAAIDYPIYGNINDPYSSPAEHWAWNDMIGWIDFNFLNYQISCLGGGNSSVCVSSQELRGKASSSYGPIYLNCSDYPPYSCSPSFKVRNNGGGVLSSEAWNDIIGWISFKPLSEVGVQFVAFPPEVAPSYSLGWAWNPVVGWFSFNCEDFIWANNCDNISYKVKTNWVATSTSGRVESAIFDTGQDGVQLNSIAWRGSLPIGTQVRFQVAATSSPDGPWDYKGLGGDSSAYYEPTETTREDDDLFSAALDYTVYNNTRYFRYKVFLKSNSLQTLTPRVDEVIVNWSP